MKQVEGTPGKRIRRFVRKNPVGRPLRQFVRFAAKSNDTNDVFAKDCRAWMGSKGMKS